MEHAASITSSPGFQALTEREKETPRRLLRGHDAKSIARELGLSDHTVNERLREARRKLNVTSSREAARLLAQLEQDRPKFSGDRQIGVVAAADERRDEARTHQRLSAGLGFAWLGGEMLIVSVIIAAVALALTLHGRDAIGTEAAQDAASAVGAANASDPRAADAARAWIALLDAQRWEESWRDAAQLFKSQVSSAQWVETIQSVRQHLGAVMSRSVLSATKTTALPGAPAGEYQIMQFQTNFAHKSGAVETLMLLHESADWRPVGYYIR